jgi:hypothetical protein
VSAVHAGRLRRHSRFINKHMDGAIGWPELDVQSWAGTKRTLHLTLQMLGKLRVALSPSQPNWLFTALLLNARGVSTGPMPWHGGSVEASLDVFRSELIVARSDGAEQRIGLLPARSVADIFGGVQRALVALAITCTLSPVPQEVADLKPLHEDHRPAEYDPSAVERWFRVVTATADVFDEWRAHFFGRTGIQLWWGALDVALLLFSGKKVAPPLDRGYLLKYDLDAEMFNAGFYPGDDKTAPFFYGYIYPQPTDAETLPIAPASAQWSDQIKEWVLPYERVRDAADPAAELRTFLDALYALCGSAAGWDLAALSYTAPKRLRHR